jgi:sugar (pentulose or hexulose) kinase
MPAGLNLGAQLFWQARRFPEDFARARTFLTYAQYWAWRLSGVAANEVTLLGSHTDLWRPMQKTWSSMVDRLGWRALMADIRPAFDRLGPVRPDLAGRLGLRAGTPVLCGIHDSNASLLPHLLTREPPFSVVSTGTWVIVLAVGGSTDRLDPARDGLAYVNAFGDPVPAGRFMGGREFDHLTGGSGTEASPGELDRVISERIMALPSFTPGVGPFPKAQGRWTADPDTLSPGERSVAASLYLALMTAECLAVAGAKGPIVVEGPFTANHLYAAALAAVTGAPVAPSRERTGTTLGAALLATGKPVGRPPLQAEVEPLAHPAFSTYVQAWRGTASRA